jgi:hypothetical protein
MNFIDLAWAAFMFRGITYDAEYTELLAHHDLLARLRTNPNTLEQDDFNATVILFLNRWKCMVSEDVALRLLTFVRNETASINSLAQTELSQLSEDEVLLCGSLYNNLVQLHGVDVAIAGKLLHIMNPSVFIPLDKDIFKHMRRANPTRIDRTSAGFSEFIRDRRADTLEVTSDFRRRRLLGSPNSYLSERLGYPHPKTLAKFIDEFYWVTITNETTIPPSWNPTEIGG